MTDNSVLGTHSNYIVKVAFGEISAALWDIHSHRTWNGTETGSFILTSITHFLQEIQKPSLKKGL